MAKRMERLVVVLASNTCIMDKEGLFLKTILCCSACDGEIAPEEIAELKSITSNMDIFKDVDVESDLNQMIESLNEKGVDIVFLAKPGILKAPFTKVFEDVQAVSSRI